MRSFSISYLGRVGCVAMSWFALFTYTHPLGCKSHFVGLLLYTVLSDVQVPDLISHAGVVAWAVFPLINAHGNTHGSCYVSFNVTSLCLRGIRASTLVLFGCNCPETLPAYG